MQSGGTPERVSGLLSSYSQLSLSASTTLYHAKAENLKFRVVPISALVPSPSLVPQSSSIRLLVSVLEIKLTTRGVIMYPSC